MAPSHLQPPRGLPVAVAVLAARCAQKLDPGIQLLWRSREVPGGTGRLLWGLQKVKVLSCPVEGGFEKEVRLLSRFRHPNLVLPQKSRWVSEAAFMQIHSRVTLRPVPGVECDDSLTFVFTNVSKTLRKL